MTDIAVERRGATVWLILDRPKAANALSPAMQEGFVRALDEASRDAAVGAVVLTGAGRVFSAGADLRSNPDGLPHLALAAQRAEIIRRMMLGVLDCRKPVVAALNGPAVGAGCMIALLCDAVVAAEGVFLSLPEIDVGMPSPLGYTVVESVADARLARDLIQSGRRMPAPEAAARGLVETCPAEDLQERAGERADALAAKPAEAFATNKEWANAERRERILAALDASHRFRERAARVP